MLMVNQLIGFGAGASEPTNIFLVGYKSAPALRASSGTSDITLTGLTAGTVGIDPTPRDGDLILAAQCSAENTNITQTITDGTTSYTEIYEVWVDDGIGRHTNFLIARKIISGDTLVRFTASGASDSHAVNLVMVWRNVDNTTPMDATATTATGTSGTPNPNSITPVTAGAVILAVNAMSGHDAGTTFTSPDMTEVLTANDTDSWNVTLFVTAKYDWTSGAFNPGTITAITDPPGSWAAATLALRPSYPS